MRKAFAILLIIATFTALFPMMVMAQNDKSDSEFSDLDKNHWAYESVKSMVKAGIMEKDSKGRFNPGAPVSRGDFAVLMVKVLDLPLVNPQQGTFLDIPENSKYYKYVETAKYYLTAYRTAQGDSFRSEEASVREDIAVAMVKALGYQPINNYNAILKDYRDLEEISPNLRGYVASVVDNKIMVGTGNDEKKMFSPQLILTRAEVAQLLYNILTAEKVTYDEGEKVTYEKENEEETPSPSPACTPKPTPEPTAAPEKPDEAAYTPEVSVKSVDDGLEVEWTKTPDGNFNYYKVVMSISESNPSYPDDGYVAVISDIGETHFTICPGQNYNGGDVGTVKSGQKYYITVTAVYNHGKYTGNVIRKEMPAAEEPDETSYTPEVSVEAADHGLKVEWTQTPGGDFNYYKVVMSISDSSPSYPDDGYITYISDIKQTHYTITAGQDYNGGDVGKVASGQNYYITVTAVYNHGKYTGNVVRKEMP